MPHPKGGHGNFFNPKHTFEEAFAFVIKGDVVFLSTTKEKIVATTGLAQDHVTPTLVFYGENSRHGNVCHECWGYRSNCSRTRIGQCTEALDKFMS
ncbi:hypothetical protein ACFL0H_00190 [Thermodesulfobacteriota bacterium]